MGMDLPIFTATYGINIIKGDGFSMGPGINLDSRTFFSSTSQKAQNILDAIIAGLVLGTKVRINSFITYYSLFGYDIMFTDASGAINGSQYFFSKQCFFFVEGYDRGKSAA
jgi:hypothetical protein